MSKGYDSGFSLLNKIQKGVSTLADNVACTLGPKGRNVILHQKGAMPIVTKDGVTVAKFVELEDPFENAAAQILKQASSQTNLNAGDGTTTATVLARSVFDNAYKYLASGISPVELKRGIDKAVKQIVENLSKQAKPIKSEEDMAHIASISANGDKEIGKLIAMAVDRVGKDGAISIEEARSLETGLDIVEGFKFDSGYVASAFVTDERRGLMQHKQSYVLVTDATIDTVEDILPILEPVAREAKALVIVAENVEGQALAALIMNTLRGTMKVAAIKAPRYGEERENILSDLALATGATFISRNSGMRVRDVKLEHLGVVKTIESTKHQTTVVGGAGDYEEVEKRIASLKQEFESTDSLAVCEKLQERITRLASGVAVIHVGGATEVEMTERKHRIEDALEAVKSAQEEGIVAGGGIALLQASRNLEVDVDNHEQQYGVEIIKSACEGPIRQMAINAGLSPDVILNDIDKKKRNFGFNFATGKVENMFSSGIIDPVKVTKNALQNGASAASTLITANFAIIEE